MVVATTGALLVVVCVAIGFELHTGPTGYEWMAALCGAALALWALTYLALDRLWPAEPRVRTPVNPTERALGVTAGAWSGAGIWAAFGVVCSWVMVVQDPGTMNTSAPCGGSVIGWMREPHPLPPGNLSRTFGLQPDYAPGCRQEALAGLLIAMAALGFFLALALVFAPMGRGLRVSTADG